MNTRPSTSTVAVAPARAWSIEPVAVNSPVDGSYSSADAVISVVPRRMAWLPAIRTHPSGKRVAVCPNRGVVMEPVAANLPVRGSYSSAEATALRGRLALTTPRAIDPRGFSSRAWIPMPFSEPGLHLAPVARMRTLLAKAFSAGVCWTLVVTEVAPGQSRLARGPD
jgi:hypothetical protein